MTLATFIAECYRVLPRYLNPVQILRLIAYARRAWQTVLNLLRRYGGLVPALPYLRRAAGI